MFDMFETLVHSGFKDSEWGLKNFWNKYLKDACTYDEWVSCAMKVGEIVDETHAKGEEYPYIEKQVPKYAEILGLEAIEITEKQAMEDMMKAHHIEAMAGMKECLDKFRELGIPMYVLSNSAHISEGLSFVLEELGMRKYFNKVWSSADFGKIKPCKEFFEMGIQNALKDNPGETRNDIIYIGDGYKSDMKGVIEAGIKGIWLNYNNEENVDNLDIRIINVNHKLIDEVLT